MSTAITKNIYSELKLLKKNIEIVKYALIPEEKVSIKELKEIKETKKEMEKGKEKSFKEIFDS